MKIRKLTDNKPRIIIFQGSSRDKDTCPNMESKSSIIVDHILKKWSTFADIKVIDLSVNQEKKPIIQPCKGCISTAGGLHCHFPCDCYKKGDNIKPDLLKELDVYELLKDCDAFVIVSPIHWHSLSSQIKTLFDRLVCTNLTLRVEDAVKLMGKGNTKKSDITGKLSKSGKYTDMLRNHLEGKTCAFYAHGDDGANDYSDGIYPDSYQDVMSDSYSTDPKSVLMPFVLQMKYSGVYVPNELIQAFYINKNVDYYTANIKMRKEKEFLQRADELMENLLNYLDKE